MAKKAPVGNNKKDVSNKLKNKADNKSKTKSQSEPRNKANFITTPTGERIAVDTSTLRGKRTLKRLKRKIHEQKHDIATEERQTGVRPEDVASVLGHKSSAKQARATAFNKAQRIAAQKTTSGQDSQDSSSEEEGAAIMGDDPAFLASLNPMQRELHEIKQRALRAEQLAAKLKQQQDDDDDEDDEIDDQDDDLINPRMQREIAQQRLAARYNDDLSTKIQDPVLQKEYAEQYSILKSSSKYNHGIRNHERSAMIEALFDNLPAFKPVPQKMLSMMKSRGQNAKQIEEGRLEEHRQKVRRLIDQRITKIRTFSADSETDDDDNDDSDHNDEDSDAYAAAFFSRLMNQQYQNSNENGDLDNSAERMLADIDSSVSLVKLKDLNKEQRAKERADMKAHRRQILAERQAESAAAAMGLHGSDSEVELDLNAVPDVDSEDLSDDDELATLEAEEARIVASQAKLREKAVPQNKTRLMVLLDDGTWGYREGDSAVSEATTEKPDLSAYVREPKQKKRKTPAPDDAVVASPPAVEIEPEQQLDGINNINNDDEEDASSRLDNANILDRFEQFKAQSEAISTMKRQRIDSATPHPDEYNSDDDADAEMLVSLSTAVAAAEKQNNTAAGGDKTNEFITNEYRALDEQLRYIEQYHATRLDRIRQVQLILGQLCTELLQNPIKHVSGGHLRAILQLARDRDTTIRQLSIASLCALFADILPAYRLRAYKSDTHTEDGKQRLSKDVRQQRSYETTLLQCYEQTLKILHQNISHGLHLFSAKQYQLVKNQEQATATIEKQRKLPSSLHGIVSPDQQKTIDDAAKEEQAKLAQQYDNFDISLHEQSNGLYTVCLKSACKLFEHAYKFNYNTQFARLLAEVLMSDHLDWSQLAADAIIAVFKIDRCHDTTLEIVQTLGEICKKKAGDKIRAPLLSVLLEIPFSAEVIQYDDPLAEKKRVAEKKLDAQALKKLTKPKGVLGAGHHFFMDQMKEKDISRRSVKKAVKLGKKNEEIDAMLAKRNPLLAKAKALKELKKETDRGLRESAATLPIEERQKLQTKCLSQVFTIFFRYLKQAPTIKTLYSYDATANTHDKPTSAVALAAAQALSTGQAEEAERHKSALLAPAQLLSIPKEHRQQVILTQTQLGIVIPPSHHVLSIVMTGIKKFGALINIELVIDLLQHCLHVIQTATDLHSLPVSSSLLILESIFTLIRIHNNAITIDLAPYYQVLFNIIWQLLPHPEYTFLAVKCVDLSILQRKQLPQRRVAAIVRRLMQVAMHLPPSNSLPLLQICSQCFTAHPAIGSVFDNERLKNASYDLEGLHPDTSEAFATPAWEFTAPAVGYHPFTGVISKHAILSDIPLNLEGPKHQGPRANAALDTATQVSRNDRGDLSLTLTTVEMPDEKNRLERPQRVTRQIAISRLKPIELYTALDVSRGGFCPDVEAPDAKKNHKALHYDWYSPKQWLGQVAQLQHEGVFNHFEPSYQSKLMNSIMGSQTPIAFLEQVDNDIFQQRYDAKQQQQQQQ